MKENPSPVEDYGAGLFRLARAADAVERVGADLPVLLDFLEKNAEVRKLLTGFRVTDEGKRSTLRDLLGADIEPILLDFLFILAEQGVLDRLEAVTEAYMQEVAGSRDTLWGELVTAYPLAAPRLHHMEDELGQFLHSPVRLRVKVNPGVIAGVRIRVGSHVFDGTVDGILKATHHAMLT